MQTSTFCYCVYFKRGTLRWDVHNGCCDVERKLALKWQERESAKQHMRKDSTYQDITATQLQQQLAIRVVSLVRAQERRVSVTKVLDAAGAHAQDIWRDQHAEYNYD